jgi:hypothetical protein
LKSKGESHKRSIHALFQAKMAQKAHGYCAYGFEMIAE